MIGRLSLILVVACAWPFAIPSIAEGPARSDAPAIRWDLDPAGRVNSVTIVGLTSEALNLIGNDAKAERWVGLIMVDINAEAPAKTGMLGSYRVEGKNLRFLPDYPLHPGKTYRATFHPSKLPGALGEDLVSTHHSPTLIRPSTVVTRVDPPGDRLPENLLKFYLHFSAPMGRGSAYEHVKLYTTDDGKAVLHPFLELGEELWDPTQTRLTILIDPGRIKRGLQPREEFGPVLEAGKTYTLVIDSTWRDAKDLRLRGAPFRKTFRAVAPDETQPDPKTWTIKPPTAGTRDPLTLVFPEPLDRALLESSLTVLDPQGNEIPGEVEVETSQTRWHFTPEKRWVAGDYHLEVDIELEDLVGNSIRRPFEVDIQRDTPARPEARTLRLPVRIEAAKGR